MAFGGSEGVLQESGRPSYFQYQSFSRLIPERQRPVTTWPLALTSR